MESLTQWSQWQLELGLPGGMTSAIVVLAIASALLALGLRELSSVSRPSRRLALGAMRFCTVTVAALIVMQPQWVGQRMERVEGKLAVIADVSRSMSVQMSGQTRRSARAAKVLRGWLEETGVAPLLYAFGDGARVMPRAELLGDAYPTTDDDTRIGDALSQVAQEQGQALGAVIVLTDGADLGDAAARQRIADLGVRVYGVLVGADENVKDDAIVEVRSDPVAFLRQEAQVQVDVRSTPARPGPVVVSLRKGGQLVRETTAELNAEGRATVTIPFPITELGRSVYTVSIPMGADDAVPENNERAFLIGATRDRLRVLLVSGRPSWDSRFLRSFLKSNPANDLITFFILRTENDISMASQDELSLIPFPTDELFREHLDSFDVVIFQDFNYGPYRMAQYLPRVRDYVLGGGAFAMVGGSLAFGGGGYESTPIADILPVEMTAGSDSTDDAPFRPVVVPELGLHPIVSLLPHPSDNARAWEGLSEVPGMNRIRSVGEGGQALLVHPKARGVDGKPMVVLAVGEPGRGRSLALSIDGSWRWGMTTAGESGDASAYERFWDRALRWLSRDPLLQPSRIRTDRPRYAPQASVRARVSLRDVRYAPRAHQRVEVAVLDDEDALLSRAVAETDPRGEVEVVVAAPADLGGYRVAVRAQGDADDGGETPWVAQEGFVVEAGGDELADPRPDAEVLRALAQATGGGFHYSDDPPDLADLDVSRSQRIGTDRERPFASAWFFALFALLFSAEWAARRAWGLR